MTAGSPYEFVLRGDKRGYSTIRKSDKAFVGVVQPVALGTWFAFRPDRSWLFGFFGSRANAAKALENALEQ